MKRLFYSISMLCALIVTSCSSDEITNSTPTPTPINLGDVYACGSEAEGPISRAVYWKNNALVYLTNGTDQSDFAKAIDIDVLGNDVYVIGYQSLNGANAEARLWKNGVSQNLQDSNTGFSATKDILLDGNDVYVLGSVNDVQVYCKNGVLFNVPQPAASTGDLFYADKIEIDGTNLAFAGQFLNQAAYMRNGVITSLTANPNGELGRLVDFKIINGEAFYCGQYADRSGSNTTPGIPGRGFYGKILL